MTIGVSCYFFMGI